MLLMPIIQLNNNESKLIHIHKTKTYIELLD